MLQVISACAVNSDVPSYILSKLVDTHFFCKTESNEMLWTYSFKHLRHLLLGHSGTQHHHPITHALQPTEHKTAPNTATVIPNNFTYKHVNPTITCLLKRVVHLHRKCYCRAQLQLTSSVPVELILFSNIISVNPPHSNHPPTHTRTGMMPACYD